MSKDAKALRRRFLECFRGAGLQHRGGFEGPEYVPPLKQEQVPLILVDGVPVRPKIVPPDSAVEPLDSRPTGPAMGSTQGAGAEMIPDPEARGPTNRRPLDWISVAGFKSIESVQKLPIKRVNVVIGANGSGKSNLINAFSFLEAIRGGRLDEYVARAGGADRVLHFGAKTTDELVIGVSLADSRNQYKVTLIPDESDRLVPLHEVPTWIQSHLDPWRLYHFHDTGPHSPFKKTCALHDNRFLRPDGSNLSALLYLLRDKHPESYELIRRTIRLAMPFFDDFVLRPVAANEDMIRLAWRQVGTNSYSDASSLSDGTLRFMAMATLLLQPMQLLPSLVLMDEPELGLHPYAITLLCSLVKTASVGAQVIIATQSSSMLDHFEPEDVLVAERREGASTFRRLNTTDLEAWLDDYSLGQLWEKNELGGRPTPEMRKTR